MTIALFLGLLALTAFFNLAEMALVGARAGTLAHHGGAAADAVLALKRRPGLFLAAIRAGDLITDLLMGAFVVTALEAALRTALIGRTALGPVAPILATVGAFGAVSYLALVFADLVPKSVALAAPERHAMRVATPLRLLILIARPIFAALEASNSIVLRLIGIRPDSEDRVTQEEIRRTLSEGLSAGALMSFERSMMERVLDLDRRSVRTVMMGRRYLQSLSANLTPDELRSTIITMTAARLMVTDGDGDTVIGTVARADLLAAIVRDDVIDLTAMAAPPAYASEQASVLSVLEMLKDCPGGLVLVLDEYGSLTGAASLADVLEAVAGDVPDAGEVAGEPGEHAAERLADGSLVVSGAQPIDDIAEIVPIPVPADRDYKTVAGLVLDTLRRIPAEGDVIELAHLTIEVTQVDHGTITRLRLVPRAP